MLVPEKLSSGIGREPDKVTSSEKNWDRSISQTSLIVHFCGTRLIGAKGSGNKRLMFIYE